MLKNKKLFLLDIDGTVCKGKQLFSGAREFLADIKASGGQFVFITNNSTKSISDYIKSFEEMGISTDYTNFVTASFAAIRHLKKNYPGKLIYVMGTKSFIRELKRNDIQVTTDCEDREIACVLISYDSELNYDKIRDTCELLSTREVDYIATNPDLVCPIEFGFVPDCGAICEMIGHAVKRKPFFIGKPETTMIDYALKMDHFTKEETIVVGDRLYTDILSGYNAGVETALVLTGEATEEDARECEYKPDYIFNSIESLYQEWKM